MKIGKKLKNRRLELGLTMREIAEKADVSEATVSRWESGNIANMRRNKIVLLANALQVTPSFIMEDISTNPGQQTNINVDFNASDALYQSPPILRKYNLLNNLGKQRADEYINDLLENPKYTKPTLADYGEIAAEGGELTTSRKIRRPQTTL